MNVVNYFLELMFGKRRSTLSDEQALGQDEIKELYLQGILSHLKSCVSNPSKISQKYETLKENFPEIAHNPQVDAKQFIDYIRILYPELDRKGDWREGLSFLVGAATTERTEAELMECYLWLSLFSGYVTNYEPAIAFARKAIELAKKLRDDLSLTVAMKYLARVYRSQGDYRTAIAYYDEVIKIAGQRNDDAEIAHSYGSKGLTYWHLKQYESALQALQTAHGIFIRLADEKRTGQTYNSMGLVYTELGLYDRALLHFEKAVEIARRRDDKKEFALTEGNIGMTYCFLKKHEMALAYLGRTMQTMTDLQHNYRLAKAQIQIAYVYWHRSQETDHREIALQYSKEGYEIGLRHNILHFQIIGASYQAIILQGLNRISEALPLSELAVTLLDRIKLFDGLEEEIYFNHYLMLKGINAAGADIYLKKAHDEVQTKLGNVSDDGFRTSLLNTELHQRIISEARETSFITQA
jgi:tetratricopeptide (TPR) repeat protein